ASAARPSTRSSWCSSVLDLALDVAELDDRQRDDDHHQDDRLRGRASEIETLEAVRIDLVHEDFGRLCGPAARRGVDDPERIEERINDVHHEHEERGG